MATNSFSFDELVGPTTGGKPKLVPADRTSKQRKGLELTDIGGTSDKIGTLPQDQSIYTLIKGEALANEVPEEFLFALADQESGYNPAAKNNEFGAAGIMQYIPQTAKTRGIDPLDPAASIRAAAQDFKAAMDEGGVEWAIKNHFAGPNTKGHGPKTRQYLADVMKRAEDIRSLLAEGNPAAVAGVGGGSDTGPKQTVGFSFDELQGQKAAPTEQVEDDNVLENAADAISGTATKIWDYVSSRIGDYTNDEDTFRGRKGRLVERTPEEIERYIKDNPYASPKGLHLSRESEQKALREQLRYVQVYDEPEKKETPKQDKKGFLANIENPMKLLTEDSLPANIIEYLADAPMEEGRKFREARRVMQQEKIVANPTKYSTEEVEKAKLAITERDAAQNPNVRKMWADLKTAAKEDPGKFGAVLANAVMADPQMLLAPEGLGIRVAGTLQKMGNVAERASKIAKAIQRGDRIVDAGLTGAGLNLAIEGAAAGSEGRELTTGEAATAAGLGAGLSAIPAIFLKGRKALDGLKAGNITKDTYEQALRDIANEDLITEQVITDPDSLPTDIRTQIEESLGISKLSEAEKKAWHRKKQAELEKTFEENSGEADYLKFKAEERIARRTQLAEEAETKRLDSEAEAAKQAEVERAYTEAREDRVARFSEEYDKALEARDTAKAKQEDNAWEKETILKDVTKKLDEEEIFHEALIGDVPAIRRAMNRAARRDSNLARPKWQRGDINQRLLTSMGIGSLFAGTAFALAPEDQKLRAAFAGGLAGLMLPKGGNVLRRMKQAGAISSDGDIFLIARLVKEGKMKPSREIADIKERETELLNLARRGDQRAHKELFEENYPTAERYARKFLRGTDIDPEDIVQEAFIKAFNNLDKFQGDSQFSTWLYSIIKNEASNARRSQKTLKGGGEYDVQSAELPDMRTAHGESYARDAFDEGAGAHLEDTPENVKIREESEKILINKLEQMNPRKRTSFILANVEGFSPEEIAQKTNQAVDAVYKQIQAAQEEILDAVQKGFGAVKKTTAIDPEVKRGRGRPRKQTGEIDPTWLKTAAILGVGGSAGAAFADKNKIIGAIAGAGAGLLLFGGGAKGFRNAVKFADDIYGASSTRILNKSKAIHRRILTTERRILENVHAHIEQVDPFLIKLQAMPKDGADLLSRALMTGKSAVIDKMLQAFNDPELSAAYKLVRKTLDSLGDQLVNLKRFSRGNIEYFPRIVKDKEGLFKAIGKEEGDKLQLALQNAHEESLRKNGRPLSEIEESAIINQMLFVDKRSIQPGFTKNRGIEEITPELQQFYASPAESLHSYIRAAVQDIEGAKFFGDYARNMKKGNHEFLDVDSSVKHLIAEEVQSGKLSNEDAREISDILRARFKEGMRAENDLIRNIKNIGNIGLLGNFWSAATQMADVGIQVYTQGLRPTIESIVRQLTGKKIVDMKDFGLADHISEEFAGQLKTAQWLNRVFKYTLFSGVDKFGKNTALNAAIIRARHLAETDSGVLKLASKYKEAFGDDFNSLVSDLKSGKITDLTRDYAFMELSRTQPITRIEMPLAYLKHPNLRSYLWLKSFTMKQLDLVRRDAYNEIKAGNRAKGIKNLTEMGIILGISGATTEQVKSWMSGKDEKLELSDIPVNMFKTFGFSEYMRDQFAGVSKEEAAERRAAGDKGARTKAAEPISAIASNFAPPFRMFDQLLAGDPRAIRFLVPGFGPYLAEQVKKESDMKKEVNNK